MSWGLFHDLLWSTSACPHPHLAISAVLSAECPIWLLRWTVRLSNRKQTPTVTISQHDMLIIFLQHWSNWHDFFFFFVKKMKINLRMGIIIWHVLSSKSSKVRAIILSVMTCWPLDLIGWGLSKWVSEWVCSRKYGTLRTREHFQPTCWGHFLKSSQLYYYISRWWIKFGSKGMSFGSEAGERFGMRWHRKWAKADARSSER